MKILSIETSCDDTGVSILEAKGSTTSASFKVLADNLSSQINIHIPYGGVYPVLAKREHIKNLPIVLEKTLKEAKLYKTKKPVDVIAVTYGPGLEMCLWEGITFAQELAQKWDVPVVPVNHMEGHIVSVFGKNKGKFKIPEIKFSVLSLLVSGGHTQLVLSKKWMRYEIIGESLDDAVGEAFDKVARMLGLPYPGGPQISKLAEEQRELIKEREVLLLRRLGSATARARGIFQQKNIRASEKLNFSLPRPMLHSKDFNFSYSGLKTAVLYLIKKISPGGNLSDEMKSRIALEFENAAIECLVYKTAKAIKEYKIKTLIVSGGVAANRHLRKEMQKITGKKIKLFFPTQELSTDNSLMIGIAGYLNYIKNKMKVPRPGNIKATGNLRL
jgi:N6-L-threonylcarbamoyladenine synthase